VVGAERESRIREQLLGPGVVECDHLEVEEHQLGGEHPAARLHPLHEGAAPGIGGVDREAEPGVRARTADPIVHRGDVTHERDEPVDVELGDRAPTGDDPLDEVRGLVEERVDARLTPPVDEGFEVPGDLARSEILLGDGHRTPQCVPADVSAAGSRPPCTTVRVRVARLNVT